MDQAKFFLASKTMLFGLATAVFPTALYYLSNVDWTQFGISPAAGMVIGGIIMGLRYKTSSPVSMTRQASDQ